MYLPVYSTNCKFGYITHTPYLPLPNKKKKTLDSSFLPPFSFAREKCFSIIQGERVSIPSRAIDLNFFIYIQQERQIGQTLLGEHSWFDNITMSRTPALYTTGIGYT